MRVYYNERQGQPGETPRLNLEALARRVKGAYSSFARGDYFQKAFGYYCVDAHDVEGEVASDLKGHFYLEAGINVERSIDEFLQEAAEVELFTFIEFVHDYVAKPDPDSGRYHSYMQCGMHYDWRNSRFDVEAGRSEWRDKINSVLKYYGEGFALTAPGEIVRLAPPGTEELLATEPPAKAGDVNVAKLRNAIKTFRRGLASREERKQAIRDLVDLLEFYRPQVKAYLLRKDEAELFSIANNFALRHHRPDQRDDYTDPWLNWLFYLYLATVHLVLDLSHREP